MKIYKGNLVEVLTAGDGYGFGYGYGYGHGYDSGAGSSYGTYNYEKEILPSANIEVLKETIDKQ